MAHKSTPLQHIRSLIQTVTLGYPSAPDHGFGDSTRPKDSICFRSSQYSPYLSMNCINISTREDGRYYDRTEEEGLDPVHSPQEVLLSTHPNPNGLFNSDPQLHSVHISSQNAHPSSSSRHNAHHASNARHNANNIRHYSGPQQRALIANTQSSKNQYLTRQQYEPCDENNILPSAIVTGSSPYFHAINDSIALDRLSEADPQHPDGLFPTSSLNTIIHELDLMQGGSNKELTSPTVATESLGRNAL